MLKYINLSSVFLINKINKGYYGYNFIAVNTKQVIVTRLQTVIVFFNSSKYELMII